MNVYRCTREIGNADFVPTQPVGVHSLQTRLKLAMTRRHSLLDPFFGQLHNGVSNSRTNNVMFNTHTHTQAYRYTYTHTRYFTVHSYTNTMCQTCTQTN